MQAMGTGTAGQQWEHRGCFPPRGPGVTPVLPPPWQRQAVPRAWGHRGRQQRWGPLAQPSARGHPPPAGLAQAPGGNEPPGAPRWIRPMGLGCGAQRHWLRGSPIPSAVVPSPGAGPPAHRERGHGGDLAGSQRRCPAWPAAKGQRRHRWLHRVRKDKHVSPAGDSPRDKLGLEGAPLPPRSPRVGGRATAGAGGPSGWAKPLAGWVPTHSGTGGASGAAHVRRVTATPPGACGAGGHPG